MAADVKDAAGCRVRPPARPSLLRGLQVEAWKVFKLWLSHDCDFLSFTYSRLLQRTVTESLPLLPPPDG
eukprot:g42176.t1